MLGSMIDKGHACCGISVPDLIPKRFVWSHGGTRVFLTGSFTGWTEHIAMTPMEGCPTVFQVVCSLAPGYHQYKFNVDGKWQHDDQQPCVRGYHGVVNSLFLAREPDNIPFVYSPGVPSRVHMDVDNDIFTDTLQEPTPMVSNADIDVSRHRISTFLSTHTAYELLPDSGKVIALDVSLPVKQAFHILYEQGLSMAPLWDSLRCQFVGVLTALDFILILKQLENHGSDLTKEQLERYTIASWKEGKMNHHWQGDGNGNDGPYPHNFVQAGLYDSLKDVALKIMQTKVATVPIIHSPSDDGSFPQLLHLASLSGILKCICRYFKHSTGSLPILQLPICSIPFGTWVPKVGESNSRPLAMLRPTASLGTALSLFVQAEVSSIPIVDDNNSLLNIYSRSDITSLAKDKSYTQIHLDELSIQQALLLSQDVNSPYEYYSGQRCHMCLKSDPLLKVMERLSNPGVRRLVVVEPGSKRVEGIISLRDVFQFLMGWLPTGQQC